MNEKVLTNADMLNLQNFIVDIVIMSDGTIRIVELNPYGEFAGSCLFDWSVKTDYDLLTGKAAKCEFRVRHSRHSISLFSLLFFWLDYGRVSQISYAH